jgi:hypothetical protein
MKSYSSTAAELSVLVVPVGPTLPSAAKDGSLFHLTEDYPEPVSGELPWFSKGMYRFQGKKWIKLVDQQARSGWGIIGACTIEMEDISSTEEEPVLGKGYTLAVAGVLPAHRKVIITGTASFWVEAEKDCHIWATVFRETEPFVCGYEELPPDAPADVEPVPIMRNYVMVALVGMKLTALTATPVSITFVDNPASDKPVTYVLQVNSDTHVFLSVNECSAFRFNGACSTAMVVSQVV